MKTLFRYVLATSFRPYYIVLVLYFAHVLNSYALAGTLLAMLPISQAFFEVPTGIISDKIGRVFSIKLSVALERVDNTSGVVILWAGSGTFNQVWDNYASLTYA